MLYKTGYITHLGPRKGAAAKMAVASPRIFALNMSLIVPPLLVNGEDPNAPARKRKMMRDAMFGLAQATPFHKVNIA